MSFNLDNIEKFYKIISKYSCDTTKPRHQAFSMLCKDYLWYINNSWDTPSQTLLNNRSYRVTKDRLLTRITSLIESNFFENQLETDIVAKIKDDIIADGALLREINKDEEKLVFTERLDNTLRKYILLASVKHTFPPTLHYAFGHINDISSNGYILHEKGVALFNNNEYKESIEYFKEASRYYKENNDFTNWANSQTNLLAAISLYTNQNYHLDKNHQDAILLCHEAISIFDSLPECAANKLSKHYLALTQDILASALSGYALQLTEKNDFINAINFIRLSIITKQKIIFTDIDYTIHTDKNAFETALIQLQCNLVLVLNEYAKQLTAEKKFLAAINTHEAAIKIIQNIDPALLEHSGNDHLEQSIKIDLATTLEDYLNSCHSKEQIDEGCDMVCRTFSDFNTKSDTALLEKLRTRLSIVKSKSTMNHYSGRFYAHTLTSPKATTMVVKDKSLRSHR